MHTIASPGLKATFSAHGARLVALEVDGVDVVFGTSLYEAQHAVWDNSAGVTVGRYAGRIAGPRFTLDGVVHELVPNRDGFQLHGGPVGFGKHMWNAKAGTSEIEFALASPDGDQGFPGAMQAKAVYGLKGNVMWAELTATTSKPTVVNLTNHAYWNLAGQNAGKDGAFGQDIMMKAGHRLVFDDKQLATGEMVSVKGTEFDFTKLRPVARAYDHCFCLDGTRGELHHGLTMRDPASGRRMEVWTSECAIQFYTAIHWNDTLVGKGKSLQQHQAIAIEPQNVPGAPNHANFPSAVLRPGTTYRNRIEWRFD